MLSVEKMSRGCVHNPKKDWGKNSEGVWSKESDEKRELKSNKIVEIS